MTANFSITAQDLRGALLRQVTLGQLEDTVLRRIRLPASGRTSSSALFLLRHTRPTLAGLVEQWMAGEHPPRHGTPDAVRKAVSVPFCENGLEVGAYVKPLPGNSHSALFAVDACVAETGAALRYACSLNNGLGLPAEVSMVSQGHAQSAFTFHPGDFLPELAAYCYLNKIPLIPIGPPPRLIASEHQFVFNGLVAEAAVNFASEGADAEWKHRDMLAAAMMQQVFNTGIDFSMEREDMVSQTCYLASRLFDLSGHIGRHSKGNLVVFYRMKHALDFPSLLKMYAHSHDAVQEIYTPLEPQFDGGFELRTVTDGDPTHLRPAYRGSASRKIEKALKRCLDERAHVALSLHDVSSLAAETALALRNHPDVERRPGVRASLAVSEIAQGYGLLKGSITRQSLAKAACIAFHHRFDTIQGEGMSKNEVLHGVVSRVIFGIALYPHSAENAPKRRRPLTAEELARALQGLTDAAFRSIDPAEGLPVEDPAFAEEAMKHPLVQQALQEALKDGLRRPYEDLLDELGDRGYLEQLDSSHATLTEDGSRALQKSLEEALARGEISAEDLAEMLKNASAMPAPPGIEGTKTSLSPQAAGELMAEMMDFQHEGRSNSSSLEDLYVHYTTNENKGMKVSPEKVDYEKLKIMIHQLEKKGLVTISGEKKRFTLSPLCLEKLLEGLIRRQETQMLERRAFRREHETDKTEIRRYKRGDVFRDISLRHTLRRIIRKAKTVNDINYTDLRAFEKKPSNQLDIAICVDVSASMKEGGKLRYAKMAIAELARAAIAKHDRVGIVAFSNLGQVVVPLTDKLPPLLEATMTLHSEQYTNMGNGLACARKMLLKNKQNNPKYIILITDGQPNAALSDDYDDRTYHARVAAFSRQTTMETKKSMGKHHALSEAGKTSRKHIKISAVFIAPEKQPDDESEKTVREITRIGAGKFHRVKSVERLPLETLATVG